MILYTLNILFTSIYNLEFIVRIFADGKYYFNDYWNIFDFAVIFATDIFILFVSSYSLGENGTILTVLKAFKILKALRLVINYISYMSL
jgi:hypothetical protein